MSKWQQKQNKQQLDHYSTKRSFKYKVQLNIKESGIPFIFGSICNISHKHGQSTFVILNETYWEPPYKIKKWLKENIKEGFYQYGKKNEFCFTRIEDAVAFKLQWHD